MSRFEESKPKLKPCAIYPEGPKLVVEEISTKQHLVLPKEAAGILAYLDGTRSVKEIVLALYTKNKTVKFKTLFTLLHQLQDAGMLEQGENFATPVETTQHHGEKNILLAEHELRQKTLATQWAWKVKSPGLFKTASIAVITAGIGFWITSPEDTVFSNTFLKSEGSYLRGIVMACLTISVLRTLKYATNLILLLLASGKAYNPALVLGTTSAYFHISDASIYFLPNKLGPLLFFLASACGYLLWMPWIPIENVYPIALLLTLWDLNPYRRSELTKAFNLFYLDKIFHHLIPYLKNRALLSFLNPRDRVLNELQLVLYATLAIAWSALFLLLSAGLFEANFANLTLALKGSDMMEQICAGLILGVLALTSVFFGADLAATLIKNLIYPLSNPILMIFRKLNSREVIHPDPEMLLKFLKKIPLFEDLADDSVQSLIQNGIVRSFRPGTHLIIQHTQNDHLFVLLEGRVSVRRREATGSKRLVTFLEPGSIFGEISVIQNYMATADVVAEGAIRALVIHRDALKQIPKFRGDSREFEQIVTKILLGDYIASSQLFKGLPKEATHVFVSQGSTQAYPASGTITAQGSHEKCFYLLVRGKVDVVINGKKISEIAQGGFFGEIALIGDVPRTASVIATEDSLVLRIESEAFWKILSQNLPLSMYIETVAENRIKETELSHA